MVLSFLKQHLQPDVIHGIALMPTHSGHDLSSVKGLGEGPRQQSTWVGHVQLLRSIAEQEVRLGLLGEQ